MGKIFGLMDCNNFFVSCERLFKPSLNNKPVVVLSNNDGCIISRSNEAKKLGIKMGEPYFQVKDLCAKNGVAVFSSNYQLYGDISSRVMNILNNFVKDVEIYSIDEAFLNLSGLEEDINEYSKEIVYKVKQWTGIPVSLGVAQTKTLAKLANFIAKKYSTTGTCNLLDEKLKEKFLAIVKVEDIWGIGTKLSQKLKLFGINTALDLARSNPRYIRDNFSILVEKIIYELNGTNCLEMETVKPKKNITSSRSFGTSISDLECIDEALATYVARAAIKLREQKSYAQAIYVYLVAKSPIRGEKDIYYTEIKKFEIPTNHTPTLISCAKEAMSKIFQSDLRYKKCGVVMLDLIEGERQYNLLNSVDNKREQVLMQIIDHANKRMGVDKIKYAAMGNKDTWHPKQNLCSNRYTTSWKDLLKVG